MASTPMQPPFTAPPGYKWVFTPHFWHYRAKRYLYARDYGRKAWAILVRSGKVRVRVKIKRG